MKIRQVQLQNIKLPPIKYIGNLIDEEKLVINRKTNQEKTLIIVAANSFYKNYNMFIHVIGRLNEIVERPYKVMVVGYAANIGYSKDVEQFENRIRSLPFSDKVELIRSVPHEEIGVTLNKADAFVMTSIQEGQPVSALEAACCGLPIFSTRCGGVEDYVDEEMGRIFDINDVEGMAEALKDYIENKLLFDSEYIRSQVVSRFGKKTFVKNFVEAFESVMNDKENML